MGRVSGKVRIVTGADLVLDRTVTIQEGFMP